MVCFYGKGPVFRVEAQFYGPMDDVVVDSLHFLVRNVQHDDGIPMVASFL